MAFLDAFDRKISELGQGAIRKTKDMSESVRISGAIREEEQKQQEYFRKIGEYFFENLPEYADGEVKILCDEIVNSRARVIQYKEQLNLLKGSINCPKCGMQISSNSVFCNNCGVRISEYQSAHNVNSLVTGKRCTNCGKELKEGQQFCTFCGAKVENELEQLFGEEIFEVEKKEKHCTQCGAIAQEGQSFCTECGNKL